MIVGKTRTRRSERTRQREKDDKSRNDTFLALLSRYVGRCEGKGEERTGGEARLKRSVSG